MSEMDTEDQQQPNHQDQDQNKDQEEYKALTSVLTAQLQYKTWAKRQILQPKQQKWASLTGKEQSLLAWFPGYLQKLEHSIELNGEFFKNVVKTVSSSWGVSSNGDGNDDGGEDWAPCSHQDLDKVRSMMIQYVREWSEFGQLERDVSFGRIIQHCELLFPEVEKRQYLNVLVPGAGLGRLVIEFVKRGFQTQGNEFSYHMLLNSSFILNSTYCANNFLLCPFVHKSSNVGKRNDQLRQVYIPDFNPGDVSFINLKYPDIPVGELMSMVAGSFVDLYGPPDLGKLCETYTNDPQATQFRLENKGKFDVVATCFFLDTASNVIDYLETVKNCLSDDGYWLNFGPLLWHYEDDDELSNVIYIDPVTGEKQKVVTPMKGLELSRDDLIQLVEDSGFKFVKRESGIKTTYGGDPVALGGWSYDCEFWICQKKLN
ncbi:unnamed protein product [Ambrosiozyma monospora]|uniref:carnosine N-methyltransferase n=1 Tax=Ambrosiozyma monospora TaxID=43982 RepID=A0A9W6Z502_AMBMO|nr:unnamed protein product [Ambrosiozyma monospora]